MNAVPPPADEADFPRDRRTSPPDVATKACATCFPDGPPPGVYAAGCAHRTAVLDEEVTGAR